MSKGPTIDKSHLEHKGSPAAPSQAAPKVGLSEKEIVERLKLYGGPLIKSLKDSAQIVFINHLFSLSKEGIVECLKFYGGDFADALKIYKKEACKHFLSKLNSLPKETSYEILKDTYGSKLIEALSDKPDAQCDFLNLFVFGQHDDTVSLGGCDSTSGESSI